MADLEQYTVGGYTFTSKQEADVAKDELNAIKYVSAKTDSKDPKQVYILYNKLLDKELFSTEIGLNYLKNLQQYLYISEAIPNEKIRPIPVNSEVQAKLKERKDYKDAKSRIIFLERKLDKVKARNKQLKTLVIILILMVIAMFVISLTSKSPTIINYETKIQDKYSSWSEDLEKREAELKIRENQLNSK